MQDLSLIIPAKYESESLPFFLDEIKNFKCKKIVILEANDLNTINSIKSFTDIKIHFQITKGYGSAIREGVSISDTKYFCTHSQKISIKNSADWFSSDSRLIMFDGFFCYFC